MSKLNKRLEEVFGTVPLDSADAARVVVQRPTPQINKESIVSKIINDPKEPSNPVITDANVNVNTHVNVGNPDKEEVVILKVEKAERYDAIRKMKGFWIENEIAKAVDALAKKGGKGFTSEFANEALREHLKRYGVTISKR